jgi:hypothetical protein
MPKGRAGMPKCMKMLSLKPKAMFSGKIKVIRIAKNISIVTPNNKKVFDSPW